MNRDVEIVAKEGRGLKPKHRLVVLAAAVMADEDGVAEGDIAEWADMTGLRRSRVMSILYELQTLGICRLTRSECTHFSIDLLKHGRAPEVS